MNLEMKLDFVTTVGIVLDPQWFLLYIMGLNKLNIGI
jgi:hypothetical protein